MSDPGGAHYAEECRVYASDCVRFMRDKMRPSSADLTVTSPPYDDLRNYDGYDFDFEKTAKALLDVTRGGGWSFGWSETE